MRVISALFFITLFPVAIFIFALLYGGITSNVIKENLSNAQVYDLLSNKIIEQIDNPENGTPTDAISIAIKSIVRDKLNGSYLKIKTEKLIDDSAFWIIGKTSTPPALSFPEIKNEINSLNPQLLPAIQQTMAEMKTEQARQAKANNEEPPAQDNTLQTFIENDFSFPMEKNLIIFKNTYNILQIALPVILVILLLSVIAIFFFSKGANSKFKWFGIVFVITGLNGFIIVFLGGMVMNLISEIIKQQDNQIVKYISPILSNILKYFMDHYINYQTISNIVLLISGVLFIILAFVFRNTNNLLVKQTKTALKSRKLKD